MKVVAENKTCIEVTGLTGRRYRANDGIFDMNPIDAKATVKAGGFWPSLSGTAASPGGFVCQCGFRPFFKTCSRCGGQAVRES